MAPAGSGEGVAEPVQSCNHSLFQTGIPGLDWSQAIKIHKGKTHHSYHNPQLQMERKPWGQLPGQPEAGAAGGWEQAFPSNIRDQESDFMV